MYNLQQSISWALPYIEYAPLSAGTAGEPAVSTATLIRNSLLSPPLTWAWNRAEDSSTTTVAGTQDYTVSLANFGFLEKVSLSDGSGNIYEIKDVYNNAPLTLTTNVVSGPAGGRARPTACSVLLVNAGTSIKIRLMPVPDAAYTVNLTYQLAAVPFTANSISSVANASAGNTSYTGTFTASLFVTGQAAMITGCTTAANNGTFTIVSCNATTLVVANPSGTAESENAAFAINASWFPIPDYYSDIYNWLFLSEALASEDDPKSQIYRQRGVAAFLAKSEGLTQTQRNSFLQQWSSYQRESSEVLLKLQQGTQGRSV